jgi:hypothetical protein
VPIVFFGTTVVTGLKKSQYFVHSSQREVMQITLRDGKKRNLKQKSRLAAIPTVLTKMLDSMGFEV